MTLLRGRRKGLEVALAGRELGQAFDELEARLGERPGFYRGTSAVATFGTTHASVPDLSRLRGILASAGIELRAVSGSVEVGEAARACELAFETPAGPSDEHELERRRALRPRRGVKLSDAARSLVADFAGARADIADRRRRGEASVPRTDPSIEPAPPDAALAGEFAPALHLVEAPPSTLYHAGTLRGGQALHYDGNVVLVGDVNPGAELIATGDVLVFGRLAGVAHAGAQGDERARVYALDLDATQLRIATFIAADGENRPARTNAARPEAALVRDGAIVVVAFDQLGALERGASLS
ncbi:MAG: septum site-determining protein MinC [Candidatus Tumulicola sp.]